MKHLLFVAMIAGCTGAELEQHPQPTTEAARLFVDEVLPMLQANCVVCHAGAQPDGAPAFLAGDSWPEIRATLLASEVIAPEVTQSRLLTKGVHTGPHLTAEQTSLILEWLTAEGQ